MVKLLLSLGAILKGIGSMGSVLAGAIAGFALTYKQHLWIAGILIGAIVGLIIMIARTVVIKKVCGKLNLGKLSARSKK